ncbi:MAG TPA: DNA polymerase III subunit delta [Candidatus Binatia bacterium]|nr:DNA polymerase III subunit delta [Candidatus Binatia bacterium]
MDPQAFRAQLRQKKILAAYLFTGDQDLLKAEAVEELRRTVGAGRGSVRSFVGGGAAAVLESQRNLSLLDPVAVIVVRQAGKLAKSEAEALAAGLSADCKGPPVVFWDEQVDKRWTLYARIARAGGEVEFVAPRRAELVAWIREEALRSGHRISSDAVAQLVELVGGDLLRLRSTLDKLSIAVGAGSPIGADAVVEHVASTREHAVWELQDAMSAKRAVAAVGVFRQLVDEGGEAPALLGALVAHVRRLLLAREAKGAPSPALLGMPPFRVDKLLAAARGFTAARLRAAIDELADIDVDTKTGRTEPVAALEQWLIAFCAPERRTAAEHVGRG